MKTLLTAQRILKGFELQGWPVMDENNVKTQIEIAEKAGNRSRIDVKYCLEVIEKGCQACRDKDAKLYEEPCQSQNADYQDLDFLLQNF